MATAYHIPLPAKFNLQASNLAKEWQGFKSQWLNYAKAAKLEQEEEGCQVAILLASIGTDAYCVYESMTLTDAQRESATALLEAFQRHCIGVVN